MSRLVDPTVCPDCRAPLDAAATCTGCGLRISGPLAPQLFRAMQVADGLVEQLRAAVPASAGPASAAPTAPDAPLPAYPAQTPAPPRQRRLPAASVPAVLLGLGALCLLVAAVVFVAVAWSVMGLTGRTLVLLGVTGVFTTVAVVVTRRGLRGAAETLWLVVAGMLTVDLVGAYSAGLFGLDVLDGNGFALLVSLPLLALGIGVALWAPTQPVARLYGVQGVALLAALVAVSTNGWGAENPAVGSTLAVLLPVLLLLPLRRRLLPVAVGLGALSAMSWLVLAAIGVSRAFVWDTAGAWWAELRGWPLLVAAGYAAAAAVLLPAPSAVRSGLAGAALAPLALLASSPVEWGGATTSVLLLCGTLAALAALTALAPLVWARGAAGVAGLVGLLVAVPLGLSGWFAIQNLPGDGQADLGLRLQSLDPVDTWAPWVSGVMTLALVAALASFVRLVPEVHRRRAGEVAGVLSAATGVVGAGALVLALSPPLWAAVLTLALGAAIVGATTWAVRDSAPASWVGSAALAYLSVMTFVPANASELLVALVVSAVALAAAVGYALQDARPPRAVSAGILAALAVLATGGALVCWGDLLDADVPARAIALAALAGLVLVGARTLSRRTSTRVVLEVAAVVVAMTSLSLGLDERTGATVLTVLGSAVAIQAVLHRDRAWASWVAVVVLGFATLVRVAADVRAPELYTLPAAALLLAAGVWRLRTDPATGSLTALGSGLVLGLLPSLLLTLDEPVSVRGALVAVAGLLVLTAGVRLRLAAPFAIGAASTALLALRHLEPIADAVPRWISLGLVGVALLVVGITWESRLRNLHSARRYLAALR